MPLPQPALHLCGKVTGPTAGIIICWLLEVHAASGHEGMPGLQLTTLLQGSSCLAVQEFDGGARGNPGPSGAGAVLYNAATGEEVHSCDILAHRHVLHKPGCTVRPVVEPAMAAMPHHFLYVPGPGYSPPVKTICN